MSAPATVNLARHWAWLGMIVIQLPFPQKRLQSRWIRSTISTRVDHRNIPRSDGLHGGARGKY